MLFRSGEDLVAKFGPMWDKWGSVGETMEKESGEDLITVATPEQIEAAKAELADLTASLLQEIKDSGVDNAEEILEALKVESAKYD